MELPNALVFESFWQLLSVLLIAVAVVLIGWGIAYWWGRRRHAYWEAALLDLPYGVVLYRSHHTQPFFKNHAAQNLLPHLDTHVLAQVEHAATTHQPLVLSVRGSDDWLIQIQSRPLPAQNPSMSMVTLHDLTHQQREHRNDRTFLQGLSHELQTPLTAIQGHLAHIIRSIDGSEVPWRGSLQVAQDEIARLAWLTPNVMALLRLDAGQTLNRQPTNLSVVAEEAVQQVWDKANTRHIALHVQSTPGLPRLAVDRGAWKQVFLNLIDNGIKYGKTGGIVTVRLSNANSSLLITIADDGPGIPTEEIPRLFSRLYRGERHQHIPGSGLGLAIVQQIVERHGGQITCTSHPGGTTFTITLPHSNVTPT